MTRNARALLTLASTWCAAALSAAAAMFGETFNYGTLDTNLTVTESSGFSFAIAGDRASLGKQAGTGSGELYVSTSFELLGDFQVTVQAGRSGLGSVAVGEMGLMVTTTNGYADVFFYGDRQINANLHISPGFGSRSVGQASSETTFRIERVGTTLSLQYDAGSGFQTLHGATDAALAGPMRVGLFLIEEFGGVAARSVWFDDLDVVADRFLPDVRSRLVAGVEVAAVLITWPSLTRRQYQVESRSALTGESWVSLGQPIEGTGRAMSVTNWIVGRPRGYYRIVELP